MSDYTEVTLGFSHLQNFFSDTNRVERFAGALDACYPGLGADSIALYAAAANHALTRGIIIADTKFELGLDADGRLVLGDEALTPDSSRFWPADSYEPGHAQDSFDKQFVRDFCEQTGWDKTDPGPELPDDVVAHTRSKYVEAFERVTTIPFDSYLENPSVVLG